MGKGTFCELYQATNINNNVKVAVKVETAGMEGSVLKWENEVLRSIQSLPYVPRHYWMGDFGDGKRQAVVMQLLEGEDMSALRHRQKDQRIPLAVCADLSLQILQCLEGLHALGFLHRDVKPPNFIRETSESRRFFMIDFGIAKRFMSDKGVLRAERSRAEFRGSTMYASLNAHQGKDQSRKDDLASLVYVFMDLFLGELPWAAQARRKEKAAVVEIKQNFMQTPDVYGAPEVTRPLAEMLKYLYSLDFMDCPHYESIRKQFQSLGRLGSPDDEDRFDWIAPTPIVTGGKLVRRRLIHSEPSEEQSEFQENEEDEEEEEEREQKEKDPVARAVRQLHLLKMQTELSGAKAGMLWNEIVGQVLHLGISDVDILSLALAVAEQYNTFFEADFDNVKDFVAVQRNIFIIERKVQLARSKPPPIVAFGKHKKTKSWNKSLVHSSNGWDSGSRGKKAKLEVH